MRASTPKQVSEEVHILLLSSTYVDRSAKPQNPYSGTPGGHGADSGMAPSYLRGQGGGLALLVKVEELHETLVSPTFLMFN